MIILIDTENAFDKTQHLFMIKTMNKEYNFLNLIKGNLPKKFTKKSAVNIILNPEILDSFPLKLVTRQRCQLSPTLQSYRIF